MCHLSQLSWHSFAVLAAPSLLFLSVFESLPVSSILIYIMSVTMVSNFVEGFIRVYNAGQQLPVLLSILMSAVLVHGYVPKSILKSVIVPIIKNKNKRISDKNNYRPICISNVFTKVVEKVLYSRMEDYLQSTNNQVGFKRKHGTEMCVFVLKKLIRYYIKHGSCMYVAFLDASKAFDRVNHTELFSKLLKLGVPK